MGTNREEWLKRRKQMLTASDVAAVLGESPFRTNVDVFMDKVSDEISHYDADHLRFGRDVEGAIANMYEARTGRLVTDYGETVISTHPDIPWLGATLDRVTEIDGDEGPLELKHVGNFVRQDDWVEEPPSHYQIQVQIQMACTMATVGSLAGLFPGYNLGYTDLKFSPEFIEAIMPKLDEFWNYNVAKKIPPAAIPHKRMLYSLKKLYPADSGEVITLKDEALELATQLDAKKQLIKDATSRKDEIEAQLRELMGEATFGVLNDGTFLSLKTTKRKAYTREVQASEYRTLRRVKKM